MRTGWWSSTEGESGPGFNRCATHYPDKRLKDGGIDLTQLLMGVRSNNTANSTTLTLFSPTHPCKQIMGCFCLKCKKHPLLWLLLQVLLSLCESHKEIVFQCARNSLQLSPTKNFGHIILHRAPSDSPWLGDLWWTSIISWIDNCILAGSCQQPFPNPLVSHVMLWCYLGHCGAKKIKVADRNRNSVVDGLQLISLC